MAVPFPIRLTTTRRPSQRRSAPHRSTICKDRMKNQPGRSVTTLWPVRPSKKVGHRPDFGASRLDDQRNPKKMNSPHLRPDRVRPGAVRQRDPGRTGASPPSPPCPGSPAAGVPRARGRASNRVGGRPGCRPSSVRRQSAERLRRYEGSRSGSRIRSRVDAHRSVLRQVSRPGRTSPAVTSTSRSATWPAQSLGKAIAAMAALSVQSDGGGMKHLDARVRRPSHRSGPGTADSRPRRRRLPASSTPIGPAPAASWPPGRRRRPPGSWRPGRRSRPRRAGLRATGHSGRGGHRARPSSGRRS